MASEQLLSTLVLVGLALNLVGSVVIVSPGLPRMRKLGLWVQSQLRVVIPGISLDYRRLDSSFEKVQRGTVLEASPDDVNEEFVELLAHLASKPVLDTAGISVVDKLFTQILALHSQEIGGRIAVADDSVVYAVTDAEDVLATHELPLSYVRYTIDSEIRRLFLVNGGMILFVGFALQAASELLAHGIGFYLQGF